MPGNDYKLVLPEYEPGGIRLAKSWFSDSAEQRRKHQDTLVEAGRLEKIPKSTKTGLTGILYLGSMVSRYVEVEVIGADTIEDSRRASREAQQRTQANRWRLRPTINESGQIDIWLGRPDLLIEDLEQGPVYFGNYINKLSKGPALNLIALISHEVEIQHISEQVET